MQASSTWLPPGGTLGRILEETRRRVTSIEGGLTGVEAGSATDRPGLAASLRGDHVAVIGEVKRKSPSKGVLKGDLNPAKQSAAMERGGAVAISVLTEPSFFAGSLDDLAAVRAAVTLPVLRKDFHIDPLQLVEARRASATAVLLIARALDQPQLLKLMQFAERLGLETIVEVRTEAELERAVAAKAAIIGVNSRDLETLEVDETVPERLMPLIPNKCIGVWESGVHDADAVRRAAACGADAVLVGSALSKSSNPEQLMRELSSVKRVGRRG
ncbi:MAG TPA: indole-3-glycerol phosphate synthase TrpC [Gemmatimonadaceae bacterium]